MIFPDSSFLIALADSDDQFHNGVASVLSRVRGAKAITEIVLSESVSYPRLKPLGFSLPRADAGTAKGSGASGTPPARLGSRFSSLL